MKTFKKLFLMVCSIFALNMVFAAKPKASKAPVYVTNWEADFNDIAKVSKPTDFYTSQKKGYLEVADKDRRDKPKDVGEYAFGKKNEPKGLIVFSSGSIRIRPKDKSWPENNTSSCSLNYNNSRVKPFPTTTVGEILPTETPEELNVFDKMESYRDKHYAGADISAIVNSPKAKVTVQGFSNTTALGEKSAKLVSDGIGEVLLVDQNNKILAFKNVKLLDSGEGEGFVSEKNKDAEREFLFELTVDTSEVKKVKILFSRGGTVVQKVNKDGSLAEPTGTANINVTKIAVEAIE